MFNPQLDELDVYTIEKMHNGQWLKTNMIDLKKGDLFRAFNQNGEQVLHEDGRKEFAVANNAYAGILGIPEIEIR